MKTYVMKFRKKRKVDKPSFERTVTLTCDSTKNSEPTKRAKSLLEADTNW